MGFLIALSGFLCVAIGAFGAHGIDDARAKALIDTGVRYQMFHTLVVLAIMIAAWGGWAWRGAQIAFLIGIVLFSGSLYAMAFGAPRVLGAVTPIGGVAFLIGWGLMAYAFLLVRK